MPPVDKEADGQFFSEDGEDSEDSEDDQDDEEDCLDYVMNDEEEETVPEELVGSKRGKFSSRQLPSETREMTKRTERNK